MKWDTKKLGEITIIKTGKLDSNAATSNGKYPFFTCDPNTLKIDTWAYDTEAVLLAGNNASGNYTAKYYKGKFNAYQRTYIIESIDSNLFSIKFICFALNQQLSLLKSISAGSTTKFLTIRMLNNLEIPCPSIDCQKIIADYLYKYDDLIENNQKQIKLLEEAAQRLYKEWFVDLRFPGHETTPIVDGLPEGWVVCSIDDLGEYINGYAFKPSDWEESGKPIIKIKELNEGVTKNTPRNSGIDVPEKYYISAGDIVFSWSATLTAMIWDGEEGLLNQHLFKVIPKDGVPREFVLQSILNALNEFKNLTTGATMKHIQRGKLKEVFLLFPKLTIMQKYQRVSEPIRNQILKLKNSNFALQEARDRLLPKLMNGEIEV